MLCVGNKAVTLTVCAGKRTKYAYVGVRNLEACERIGAPMFGGFAKLELAKHGDDAIAGTLDHGPGKFGSEPFFVAAHSDPSQCDGELLLVMGQSWLTVGQSHVGQQQFLSIFSEGLLMMVMAVSPGSQSACMLLFAATYVPQGGCKVSVRADLLGDMAGSHMP